VNNSFFNASKHDLTYFNLSMDIFCQKKAKTKKLKTGLIGRYPSRLEQKAEYLLSLVLVQADRVEGAGNLTTPLQRMISQQARLDYKRRIPLCAQGYKSMTKAFSIKKNV
jgi:hypothetical protein